MKKLSCYAYPLAIGAFGSVLGQPYLPESARALINDLHVGIDNLVGAINGVDNTAMDGAHLAASAAVEAG
ncbi:MAG: hypothetical protein HQ478_06505 [Chloroflexi bacterium]|nr:hypothetical protein [Chloroflexota bacterium]